MVRKIRVAMIIAIYAFKAFAYKKGW